MARSSCFRSWLSLKFKIFFYKVKRFWNWFLLLSVLLFCVFIIVSQSAPLSLPVNANLYANVGLLTRIIKLTKGTCNYKNAVVFHFLEIEWKKKFCRIWPVSPFRHFWSGFGVSDLIYNLTSICEIDVICVQPGGANSVFNKGEYIIEGYWLRKSLQGTEKRKLNVLQSL